MRGLIAVLLFVWGVAFGLAEPTPPSQAPGAAADASGPRQPASSLANEPRVLEGGGERFDNLAAIVADLSRRSRVLLIAVSPDGRSLASGSEDKTIHLWDLTTGKELRRLQGHTAPVWSVAFAPDGRSLASGSDDKTIRLWDLASGKELRRLEGHTGTVYSVAFAPDGRSLASGSEDNTIRLWDLAGGKELRRLEGHTGTV